MPEVRTLRKPPITEGLIDIRVDACRFTPEKLHGIAQTVQSDYPNQHEQREFHTKLEAPGQGKPPEARTQDLGLRGGRLFSKDRLQVCQFRSDGFTFNRLAPYTGWEAVFPEAMRLWSLFVGVFEPETVKRVTVRYINHIPLSEGRIQWEQYLRAPIPLPPELDHDLTSFLTSVVVRDPSSPSVVKVTQSLQPPHPGPNLVLLLDIEAFQHGEWNPSDPDIWNVLGELRALKNQAFFATLTESLVESFE